MISSFKDIKHIGIVGTGMMGASLGLSLKKMGYTGQISGYDHNQKELLLAKSIGAVDKGYDTLDGHLSDVDLLIIAVPVGGFEQVLALINRNDHAGLTITDIGSTKSRIVQLAETILLDCGRFIGSHPMAGNEYTGALGAKSELFTDRTCIITKTNQTYPKVEQIIKEMWTMLGMHLLEMNAAEHDISTASTSHLPHATSVILVNAVMRLGGLQSASTGFIDVSRLASSNPAMRLDIMKENRKFLIRSLSVFENELEVLLKMLKNQDDDDLFRLLSAAKYFRDDFLDKNISHDDINTTLHKY